MRLDKALTLTGLTRKQAKRAIAQGRACVRGVISRDAGENIELCDVTLDGAPIGARAEIYVMLNKPAGVVTAREDARWGTVMDSLSENIKKRAPGPVGRLDRDVTGLVILTTDGELAHRLISPKRGIAKIYRAQIEGALSAEDIDMLERGVEFKEYVSRPAFAEMVADNMVEITVTEGKYHEVKALLARAGHPVIALKRIGIAGLRLDENLSEGQYRALTDAEIDTLKRAVGMEDI